MGIEDDFDQVIWSPNCKPGTGGKIVALGVHSTEGSGTAANVGYYFQNDALDASTTGVFGDDDAVGCVEYGMTAYHSGHGDPWNYRIEGYEHVAFAAWSTEEWMKHGKMLDRSARHMAKRAVALGIPIRKIDGTQLRRAVLSGDPSQGGFCGHKDISDATDGGHWDPGPGFPWGFYLNLVKSYANGEQPTMPEDPILVPELTPEQIEENELMSAKDDIITAINTAKDEALSAIAAAKQEVIDQNRADDDKWMGRDERDNTVWIVFAGFKTYVEPVRKEDGTVDDAATSDRIQDQVRMGYDYRGDQGATLADLTPTGLSFNFQSK